MNSAGIDGGEFGAKISALDEWVPRAEAAGAPTQELKASRKKLILQRAVAAVKEDGSLPGADAEYRRAREAQIAVDKHEKGMDAVRTARFE